ncbi:hypothetical protein CEE44_01250 [Candidatus Woesearchaeota archaeon B3_Woes]|nr:MAG: hypothetical protein CEE44_01250 [Candidatus Woesearchaeota archaeon B3_Woes]
MEGNKMETQQKEIIPLVPITEKMYEARLCGAYARANPTDSLISDIKIRLKGEDQEGGLAFLARHPDGVVKVGDIPEFTQIGSRYGPEVEVTLYKVRYGSPEISKPGLDVPYDKFVEANMPTKIQVKDTRLVELI